MTEPIRFSFNGKMTVLDVEEDRMLLWVLRTELGLTGTKSGCGEGFCGSCTVLVDGKPERSCQLPMSDVAGKKIVTIEGLARDGKLHPVQTAFVEHDALQCGFCTPGMILSAFGLLLENPEPTRQQILDHMEDNLCRCGAHLRIVKAIETAAAEMRKGVRS
ncbi:MAG: (2Fe-2S)-binding protein [Acidobacteria bacterium]|uniref:(2Fe-2S)-binding protein n=1 Tax=Candidatus Sulfomarinibacter kjeldsenii TaxID=2885994 RepID=A0A8J7CGI6_9BACT|nr:(2Fe-2S)-binding protein [Candidatus Sulfomarinibacter kjeldsenii]